MRFSIIIPCYNVAPWVRACVESVGRAAERLGDGRCVEAVCVDDGSTDGTGAILDEMAKEHGLMVIHQENKGVSAARNRGLEAATGEWVTFVDADDLMAPGALTEASRLARLHPDATFLALGAQRFDDGGALPMPETGAEERVLRKPRDIFSGLAMISCCQMYVRRQAVQGVRFPPYTMGEDRVYVYRVARVATKAVLSQTTGAFYRNRATSASHGRPAFGTRLDDLRHVVHVLAILLATPGAGGRMRLRYARATVTKFGALLGGGR